MIETYPNHFAETVECIRKKAAFPGAEFRTGRRSQHEASGLTRVVWVATGGNTEPAKAKGVNKDGQRFDLAYEDVLNIECRITGRDMAEAEALRRNIIAAAYNASLEAGNANALMPTGYTWEQQREDAASDMYACETVVQLFELRTAIAAEVAPLVTITADPQFTWVLFKE